MVGDGCAVVVCDGATAFLVDEVTDKRGVEDEVLRAHLVAGHAVCEGGDFGGSEGGVPDADFGDGVISKNASSYIPPCGNKCFVK